MDFCHALNVHHTGEDVGVFPVLRERFPALEPVLEKFAEEHKVVAELQNRIKELVEDFTLDRDDPVRLRVEVADLSNRLEAHFDEDERQLVTADFSLRCNKVGTVPLSHRRIYTSTEEVALRFGQMARGTLAPMRTVAV